MDKNQVVKSEPDIKSGEMLIKAMDQEKIEPSVFVWFYLSESDRWRLLIASDSFENKEPKDSYRIFIEKFADNEYVKKIGLSNITILPNKSDLINILKMAIRTDKKSISGIRFTSSVINGVFIDDAYIYRLA